MRSLLCAEAPKLLAFQAKTQSAPAGETSPASGRPWTLCDAFVSERRGGV